MDKKFALCNSNRNNSWLIVTMIFSLGSEPHSFPKTFFLFSVSRLAPTLPFERLVTARKTNTDQTGGVNEILTQTDTFFNFFSDKKCSDTNLCLLRNLRHTSRHTSCRWLRCKLLIRSFINNTSSRWLKR